MSFLKLTEAQKKRAKTFRAELRRRAKTEKQLEITLACFAYVAGSDSSVSPKEVKYTATCLNAFKDFASLEIKISASNLKAPTTSYLTKLLSQTKHSSFSQRAFQRQLLTQLIELCVCDGPLLLEEELAVEHIANCLKFPTAAFMRLKARGVSNEKIKEVLKENRKQHSLGVYYKTLGCSPTDSLPSIKKAFRKLAAIHHPDKHASKNPAPREAKQLLRNFQRIQEAYEKILQNLRSVTVD